MQPCLHFPRGSTTSLPRIQLLEGDPGPCRDDTVLRRPLTGCESDRHEMGRAATRLFPSRPLPIHPSVPMFGDLTGQSNKQTQTNQFALLVAGSDTNAVKALNIR